MTLEDPESSGKKATPYLIRSETGTILVREKKKGLIVVEVKY
jgi:hypothetical protein